MSPVVVSSPHGPRENRVDRIMGQVLLALIPGVVALVWIFGTGVLVNLVLASVFAVAAEASVLAVRGRPILPTLKDLSALVTAALFAVSVPPALPWWLTLLGMLFAIVLVKQLYGGLGWNVFNPAMAAYVFLLVSYPMEMTAWLPPQGLAEHTLAPLESLRRVLFGEVPAGISWDALTGATPLDALRTALGQGRTVPEIADAPFWGRIGGRGWEWVNAAFLLGGLGLLARRIVTWHIPAAMLGTLAALAGIFWAIDPGAHAPPSFHLFSGAAMLGAFFIATDPVTASTTRRGQLLFGAAVGAVVFVIRTWGGYPDGVAFGVLLLNIAAPTIDHYTRPRVFGHGRGVP